MQAVRVQRIVLLSVASGIAWAAIAFLLGSRIFRDTIWGGVVLSPLIGVALGFASSRFPSTVVPRALFSLLSLYVATALFGFGVGMFDLLTEHYAGAASQSVPGASVIEAVLGTLWGVTFTGYLLVLWPLCYANHHLLSREWLGAKSSGPA